MSRLTVRLTEKKNGYAIGRERWVLDWNEVNTPLGLPGQRQAICTRTSFAPLREETPTKESESHFYATDLPPHRADAKRLGQIIRDHWAIENRLHHAKDRTWLEDRHWVGNKRTGAAITMLRTLACCIVRKARFKGLSAKAYCPERIEFFNQYPDQALRLVKGTPRL